MNEEKKLDEILKNSRKSLYMMETFNMLSILLFGVIVGVFLKRKI